MLTILTVAALAATPAAAADHEVSVEYANAGAGDPRFDLVHDGVRIGTLGVRGAVSVHDRVSVVASWHAGAWGNDIDIYDFDGDGWADESEYYEDYDYNGNMGAAYRGHRLTVGPKADLEIGGYFRPYATLQGVLYVGRLAIDDDLEEDDNLNQLVATGVQPGGRAGLGFDIVPYQTGGIAFGFHLEGGYELTASGAYRASSPTHGNTQIEIARYAFGGFYALGGVGLYF